MLVGVVDVDVKWMLIGPVDRESCCRMSADPDDVTVVKQGV